jgi:DNA-binding transcriptional regulator YdaS (Cro superfamily)
MNFASLERRLLEHLRGRVRRGEISNSALARLLRLSPAHVHNLLNGVRQMTPEVADTVLRRMGLEIEDLLSPEELRPRGMQREFKDSRFREAPILKGRIAAGQPFPLEAVWTGSRAFTSEFLKRYTDPILVKVGPGEISMLPTIQPNDLLLLDQSSERRKRPRMTGIYALSLEDGGTVKRCEIVGNELVIMPENMQTRGFSPRTISLVDRDILEIIKGEVVWIGREL